MNKMTFAIALSALAILPGCFHNKKEAVQPTPEPQQEVPVLTQPMPAPGFESVPEMVVSPDPGLEPEEGPTPEPTPTPLPNPTPSPQPTPSPTPDPEPVPEPSPAPKPVTRTFSITAKQWSFDPARIVVNEGDTVVLKITSIDVDHGLAISAFGVNVKLKPNTTETVTFVADKKGTYTFSCNVFCGSGHGSMKGTLVVE